MAAAGASRWALLPRALSLLSLHRASLRGSAGSLLNHSPAVTEGKRPLRSTSPTLVSPIVGHY